jgi:hypothetical protein
VKLASQMSTALVHPKIEMEAISHFKSAYQTEFDKTFKFGNTRKDFLSRINQTVEELTR